jgi:hypothetical protein
METSTIPLNEVWRVNKLQQTIEKLERLKKMLKKPSCIGFNVTNCEENGSFAPIHYDQHEFERDFFPYIQKELINGINIEINMITNIINSLTK